MSTNGQTVTDSANNVHVLHWGNAVLAAEDLKRNLNGHRRVVLRPGAVITPMAAESLRAGGIIIEYERYKPASTHSQTWASGHDRDYPFLRTAVDALAREGFQVLKLTDPSGEDDEWVKACARHTARRETHGVVLFSGDPGFVCCVANKVPGVRAVAVGMVPQARRALETLGANFIAVEMPGRTFFEIREILRLCCVQGAPVCPESTAKTLRELDGHAHR